MDYFFWHKTFGTNFFLNIQGRSQNYIKTSKIRHGGTTLKFSKQTLIFGHPLFRHFFPENIYQ
jgi:hypothetical protein